MMDTNTATATTAANHMADFTHTIWVSKKDAFEKKMKHLNRILKRHGKDPIRFSYSNTRTIPVEFEEHVKGEAFANDRFFTRMVEVCDVHCTGLTVVKKDDVPYAYLGIVSFDEGVKQVFCNNEEYAMFFMDGFRDHFCDHCKTRRTNRKKYYLFLNTATDDVLQIGSTCAKEYFGFDSAEFLETYGNTFLTIRECSEGGLGGFKDNLFSYGLAEVIPAVSLVTKGFLKWNKRDGECFPELPIYDWPTVSALDSVLSSWDRLNNGSWSAQPVLPSDGDRKNAALLTPDEIVQFWENKFANERSTFAYNCLEAVRAGYTTHRSLGAFAYAIFAAFNAKVRAMQDEEAAKTVVAVPCPFPVNSRQTIEGRIANVRSFTDEQCFDGYHVVNVTKFVIDFTADNGTLYHFTTASETFADLRNGDRVAIRATIGETKPFRGVPYTHLSRPKAEKIAAAA